MEKFEKPELLNFLCEGELSLDPADSIQVGEGGNSIEGGNENL